MGNVITLEELFDNNNKKVYDFTNNGKCSSCGRCCSNFLPLSEKDIKRIRKYIKVAHIKEIKHSAHFLSNSPLIDMTCPFLRDTNEKEKCAIYAVKPRICTVFQCSDWKDLDLVTEKTKEFNTGNYEAMNVRETFFGSNK